MRVVTIDVRGQRVDLALVDRLARARVDATRAGEQLRVVGVTDALRELVQLCGLCAEVLGETEGGDEPLDVEEAVQRDDPSV